MPWIPNIPPVFLGEITKISGCREILQSPSFPSPLDAEIAARLQILRFELQKAAADFFPAIDLHRYIPISKTGTRVAIQIIVPKKTGKNRRHKESKPVSFCRLMVI